MAIDFGNTRKIETDKAMEVLQKWSGPIYEGAAKRGFGGSSTTKTHDPSVTARLMRDIPSQGEIILGGVQGAISGYAAGKSMASATGGDVDFGKAAGSILGGYLGAAGYAGGREGGQNTGQALNSIAQQAAGWEQQTKQKAAEDAIASMGQRFAVLNNPQTPEEAIKFASEKDALVAQTAQRLYSAGVAPDKAIVIAENIASIHDPSGKYSPIGMRANAAMMKYNASAQAPADKVALANTMKQLVMEKRVSEGELPFDMGVASRMGAKAGMGAVTMAPSLPAPTIPMQQAAVQPNQYAAQTNAQGVPAYLQPNAAPTPTIKAGGSFAQGKDAITTSVVPQFGPNIDPRMLAIPQTVDQVSNIAGGDKGKAYEQASVELATNVQKIRSEGAPDAPTQNLLTNIDVASKAIDQMIEIVASQSMPSGIAEMWGSEIYNDGLSPGMAATAGAAAGGAAGIYLGAHTGPLAPAAIPLASKGLAAVGAGIGATVGKGFAGMGKGSGPFLEDSDKVALDQISVLATTAKTSLGKVGDPNSQVTASEAKAWEALIPSAAKKPINNLTGLIKMKEILAQRAESVVESLRAGKTGAIQKVKMENAADWEKFTRQEQYREAQKNKAKTYGINFF